MKKTTSLLIGAALVAIAMPAGASAKMVKQCKDLGISEIKNCASCHKDKKASKNDLNEIGQWLVAQKEAKKAAECDMAWLKDYFAARK
jgi:cytochrome c553